MIVVDTEEVANWLDRPDLRSSQRLALIVDTVNGLLEEKWKTPVSPAPPSVRILALTMAARALTSTPGQAPLQSITKSADDVSRTERYAISDATASGYGVYITEDELLVLNPQASTRGRVGSIRLTTALTGP